MKFSIGREDGHPYFTVVISGFFSLPVLEQCYREILNHPQWKRDTDILWDARQCTFEHLNTTDLHAIGQMTLKYRDIRGRGHAVWVVAREIDYGISRMFEMLQEGRVSFAFRVFKDITPARQFLADDRNSGRLER